MTVRSTPGVALPAADGQRGGADRGARLLGRDLEHLLEVVRARRRRGHAQQSFALGPLPAGALGQRRFPLRAPHSINIGRSGRRLERIRANALRDLLRAPEPAPLGGRARSEHALLKDALAQVELADRLGFDYVWEVEHHFLEEYSHSSAPEVFLAAAAARTERIRLGHGIVQIPPAVNHPARVAERVATLDLISDGRVDFGTGESSSAAELGGFLVDRTRKREMWEDAMDAITRMFVEEPFAGWDSEFWSMPPRNVVPKPLQKPASAALGGLQPPRDDPVRRPQRHRRAVVLVRRARGRRAAGSRSTTS